MLRLSRLARNRLNIGTTAIQRMPTIRTSAHVPYPGVRSSRMQTPMGRSGSLEPFQVKFRDGKGTRGLVFDKNDNELVLRYVRLQPGGDYYKIERMPLGEQLQVALFVNTVFRP